MARSLLALLVSIAAASRISEQGIAGDASQSLDGIWNLQALGSKTVLQASVPGDLITDLHVANLIGDPL